MAFMLPRPLASLVLLASLGCVWVGCGGGDDAVPGAEGGDGDDPATTPGDSAFGPRDGGGDDSEFDAAFGPGGDGGVVGDGGDNPDECLDPADQGDTPAAAKTLPDLDDGVDDSLPLRGVLNGSDDEDFFVVKMNDTAGGVLHPYMTSKTSGVEICMFPQCASDPAKTDFSSCRKGTLIDKAGPNGMSGCCSASPGELEVQAGCSGFGLNDSLKVFIRVKQSANKCTSYEVGYHG